MTARGYVSPAAFKQALEQRLRSASRDGQELPRSRPNTRVKDLPDLALLASVGALNASRLRAAFAETFGIRETHSIPSATPVPPEAWRQPYARLAARDRLPWKTLEEVTAVVRAFLDPVLAGDHDLHWEPGSWSWRPRP